MTDQRDDAVRKGAHCAWQIHYHIAEALNEYLRQKLSH